MKSLVLAFGVAVLGVSLIAQGPSSTPIKPPPAIQRTTGETKPAGAVTVSGCLHGTQLEPLDYDWVLQRYGATAYDLSMSKGFNEQLLGHQGHYEKVTGTLVLPDDPKRTTMTGDLGPTTHVSVGRATSAGSPTNTAGSPTHTDAPTGVPRIAVKAVQHLSDKCAALANRDVDPRR